ncbi:M23 family metallopeptidase [Paraliomyxa miuraensis]|uniref:M23 family metallopeptidase n=1 Tax=Paraliomyxa miuraensis TaxID=376150 RepID=UPI00224DE161|nr:M23 family metallopeptidase [Paraliomyxa miuraensis]MCX4246865.1 M23 family metallopeptidase [Paraliomyxa miuraensis]
MRRQARWTWGSCLLAGSLLLGCSEPAPEATEPAPAPEATPAEGGTATDGDESAVEADGPFEPSVALTKEGKGEDRALAERTPGTQRRLVIELELTTSAKKKLRVPITRIAADVVLESIGDEGSSYRFTPREVTVLTKGKVADEATVTALQTALAPGDTPAAVSLTTDRWDVVTALPWPTSEDSNAVELAAAERLALGHLMVPVPALTMKKGTRWEVRRRIDVLGIPTWQTLSCTAKAIDGKQLELDAKVTYGPLAEEPFTGTPLGLSAVASVSGQGKLRARYDLSTGTPIDMALQGRLDVREAPESKPKRFGFELHVDEDYMAQPDPRVTLKGQLVQGGLVHGIVPPDTKVWFEKEKVKVSAEGDFLIGFGRDASPRALLSFAFAGGPPERRVLQVADRVFEPEEISGLPTEMVDLDKETRKALNKSKAKISRLRRRSSDVPYFRDGFDWPLRGKITSTYGRERILNDEDHGYHWGVDVGVPVGKKVKAPAGGVVVLAEKDVPLSGNLVILDHGHGLTSSFLHLDKLKVKEGDVVKAGQVIATSGNTGRSTGPHLDWRMNLFDTRIDPQTVVEPMP